MPIYEMEPTAEQQLFKETFQTWGSIVPPPPNNSKPSTYANDDKIECIIKAISNLRTEMGFGADDCIARRNYDEAQVIEDYREELYKIIMMF
jgi:hypothetical protein